MIRDWGCPHEFPYGDIGGEDYVRKQLQEKPSQHQQLKRIRKNLNGDFLEIGGFLLPYPGKTVATNHRFAGLVKDIDEEFLEFVKILVPYVVPENKLTTKRMNCKDVKGKDMLVYIKNFFELLSGGDYNTLETAVEATAAAYRNSAFEKAYKLYENMMEKPFKNWNLVSQETLKIHHTLAKQISLNEFTDCPRIKLAETEHLSIKKLEKKMEEKYPSYAKRALDIAEANRKAAYKKAYKLYQDEMEKLFERWDLVSLDNLIYHHTLEMKKALEEFKIRPKIKDAKQENLYLMKLEQKIEDKYPSYEKRLLVKAAANRGSAFKKAYQLYEEDMERFLRRTIITFGDLKKHHTGAKEKSFDKFKNCPRIQVPDQEKSSLMKLEMQIDEKYSCYEKVTTKKIIGLVKTGVAAGIPTVAGAALAIIVGSPLIAIGGAIGGAALGGFSFGYTQS